MRTFFLEPGRWRIPFILDGPEARHIARVLRLKNGDSIRLLDGQGKTGEFALTAVAEKGIKLEPVNIVEHPRRQRRNFLAAAYTRVARRSFMLEKAVELEAGGIWFWQAERSQAKVPDKPVARWREQLIAGAKQSLNPWLPELRTLPGGAEDLFSASSSFKNRFLLWEEADPACMLLPEDLTGAGEQEDILFVMGPEGGLSPAEAEFFVERGFRPVSLGRRILRWETAAVLCLGLAWWTGECSRAGQRPV
ncbi:MAG: 16S rRNA (uracil(1498)-N(3))-methyltransferase [Deltaproteobacteria bacterium]|jgi:16S rRNA (uracil1498-N3)-methyltransferase|nr:16S rRNA (uracil(1498)-N(3))-methyltransferase [Deltaproteobacteria bacterium]